MSVNKYDASTGQLVTLASGGRTWIGTKAAYEAEQQAGTLPNDCLIAITDDENDRAVSGTNLLDNPWFTVNQRGQSSYSGASIPTAFVDRWKMNDNMSCVVNADKTLTFTNSDTTTQKYFCNRFEHGSIEGKTVTLSILLSDNTIFTQTDIFPTTTDTVRDKTIDKGGIARLRLQNVAGFNQVVIFVSPNSNVTVKAVKLEIGTASTLENDTAPNYQQELAKCQRYFQRFSGDFDVAFAYTANILFFNVPLNVPLRTTPNISGTLVVKNCNGASTVSGFTFSVMPFSTPGVENNRTTIQATKTSHGLTTNAFLSVNANDPVGLSADL